MDEDILGYLFSGAAPNFMELVAGEVLGGQLGAEALVVEVAELFSEKGIRQDRSYNVSGE